MGTYLGQNFLNNEKIIDFIIEQADENADKNLETIEIGPGKCALTEKLQKLFPDLKLFEKDETFFEILQKCVKKENIIMGDFLGADLGKYIKSSTFNAFGNLPYYITSPIFRKLTGMDEKNKIDEPYMKYGIFMIQKEVGDKIKTNASKKSMLWYLLNKNYTINYLITVPAKDFTPPPKVDSCLVEFVYHGKYNHIDNKKLFNLLKILTAYKKKTLGKINKILEKQGKKLNISEDILGKRMHEISYDDLNNILK